MKLTARPTPAENIYKTPVKFSAGSRNAVKATRQFLMEDLWSNIWTSEFILRYSLQTENIIKPSPTPRDILQLEN